MFGIVERPGLGHRAGGVADREEPHAAAGFRLVGVDRHLVVIAPARMGHVIGAAADRAPVPAVVDVEHKRRMHADRGMQRIGRRPGAEAHAGHVLAGIARGMQRQAIAVAGDRVAHIVQARHLDLQPLDGAVDVAHRAAATRLLAQHVPGLERVAKLHLDAALRHFADQREAELEVRREPLRIERIARGAEIGQHVLEILLHEVRQHEVVVQARAPAAELLLIGPVPEGRDQAAQQRLLRHAHLPVRRHLEGAQLEQAAASGGGVRREQLVDAELGAMRVAGRIDQQVAEDAVDQPGRGLLAGFDLTERDLQFVQRVVARLVDARMLAGRADEQAGEEIRQRRMVEPVAEQALQKVRSPQQRRIGGGRSAQHHVVAAAGPGVAAVDHELLRPEPRGARLVVDDGGLLDELLPVLRGMDVDLDHAGIGRDAEILQARIAARRSVAFEEDRLAELLGGVLHGGDEVEIVLGALGRRHEDVKMAVARLEGHRGAHDIGARGAGAGLGGEIGGQRALPGLAGRGIAVGLAVCIGRQAGSLRAQQRRAAERVERRQGRMLDHGIGLDDGVHVAGHGPGQRVERQPIAQRRIARDQVAFLRAQEPRPAAPAPPFSVRGAVVHAHDRQHRAGRCLEPLLEDARDALALHRILRLVGVDLDVAGQAPLPPQIVPGVLEGLEEIAGIELQPFGQRHREAVGDRGRGAGRLGLERGQRGIAPDLLAVLAPVAGERPARQLLSRIPFALAEMQHRSRGEAVRELAEQHAREAAFLRPQRQRVPLRAVHVVDRHEGRLAAHGETHVALLEGAFDLLAAAEQLLPLLVGVGLGGARCLAHARHLHLVRELDLALVDAALDRRGARRFGRAGERDMALARQQARGRIEPDPPGARQVDFAPGMEIGEVAVGTFRPLERLLVGLELDQVARGEARGETEVAQDRDQQPAGVAA